MVMAMQNTTVPSTYPSFDDTTFFTLLKSNSLYWRKTRSKHLRAIRRAPEGA